MPRKLPDPRTVIRDFIKSLPAPAEEVPEAILAEAIPEPVPEPEPEPTIEERLRALETEPPKKAVDSIPELDPWTEKPVYENGQRAKLTVPVKKLSLLQHDKGRGMMPTEGEKDPVYARFIQRLDMDELREALAKDNSPKAIKFLSHLANPLFASVDITTLAKRCSIGYTEMMQIWRSHKLSHAMGVYIEGSPVLAEHLVEDAKSVNVCCGRCDGAGTIRVVREEGVVWIECVNCQGKGTVRRVGDAKARETIFKSIGFIRPDGGNSVSVNINTQSPTVSSVLDELERLPAVTINAIPEDD